MNNVFVVIPAYNEEETIFSVISDVKKYFKNVIVVDDASKDSTADVACRGGAEVLSHPTNRGQGAALRTGIKHALRRGADIIVTFDADGQHKADEISLLVEPVIQKIADVVLGSRFLKSSPDHIPFTRRILLKGGVLFTRVMSRINVTDTHNGFRAFSKNAAKNISIRQGRMAHASEILDEITRNHLRFKEIPVTILYSKYSLHKGQSSLNAIKIALTILLNKLVL